MNTSLCCTSGNRQLLVWLADCFTWKGMMLHMEYVCMVEICTFIFRREVLHGRNAGLTSRWEILLIRLPDSSRIHACQNQCDHCFHNLVQVCQPADADSQIVSSKCYISTNNSLHTADVVLNIQTNIHTNLRLKTWTKHLPDSQVFMYNIILWYKPSDLTCVALQEVSTNAHALIVELYTT
jgi:hypothetical protein